MVFAGTALTMPNEVKTQYRPAPMVTYIVAFGTSERGVRVSSAMGATMSKAAIARTAKRSAFRKPDQPAVAAAGVGGWEENVPANPRLMGTEKQSTPTKPAPTTMQST